MPRLTLWRNGKRPCSLRSQVPLPKFLTSYSRFAPFKV
nr:MAG TPA: hypothetical protein [Inoviridae sp.]